jgi:hypothetical protein
MRNRNTISAAILLLFAGLTILFLMFHIYETPPPVHAQLASFTADPCNNSGAAKLSAFANITTATTTQLVALVTGKQIFVCGSETDISSTTASTLIYEYGTGASCGTGTTVLSHTITNSTLVNAGRHLGSSGSAWITAPAGNALCVLTTVGTTPTIGVTVTYVQQ